MELCGRLFSHRRSDLAAKRYCKGQGKRGSLAPAAAGGLRLLLLPVTHTDHPHPQAGTHCSRPHPRAAPRPHPPQSPAAHAEGSACNDQQSVNERLHITSNWRSARVLTQPPPQIQAQRSRPSQPCFGMQRARLSAPARQSFDPPARPRPPPRRSIPGHPDDHAAPPRAPTRKQRNQPTVQISRPGNDAPNVNESGRLKSSRVLRCLP